MWNIFWLKIIFEKQTNERTNNFCFDVQTNISHVKCRVPQQAPHYKFIYGFFIIYYNKSSPPQNSDNIQDMARWKWQEDGRGQTESKFLPNVQVP